MSQTMQASTTDCTSTTNEESDGTRQNEDEDDDKENDSNNENENDSNERRGENGDSVGSQQTAAPVRTTMMVNAEEHEKAILTQLARDQLFRAWKFISDDDMRTDGQLARYVAMQVGYRADGRAFYEFWNRQQDTVKKAIDSKRSSTSQAIKK